MFPVDNIPQEFINQIINLSTIFMHEQINTINQNIYYFGKRIREERISNGLLKDSIAKYFIKNYKLKPINISKKIVPFTKLINNTFQRIKGGVISEFIEDISDLHIVIGKQINGIHFTEFCDIDLLEKLNNIAAQQATESLFLKPLQIDISVFKYKLHSTYSLNNSLYMKNVFHEFNNLLQNLSLGDSVILTGYIFLTRFEVGLLYLLMSSFHTVEYFEDGVIIFKNCLGNVNRQLEFFKQIKNSLNNVEKPLNNGLILSVLTVVKPNYIFNSFIQREIKNYNRTTINFYLKYLVS